MEFIFNFLNIGALLGWSFLLVVLLLKSAMIYSEWIDPFFVRSSPEGRQPLIDLLLFLEMICFVEVGRIAIGQLKGNFTLGIILHMIRGFTKTRVPLIIKRSNWSEKLQILHSTCFI